MGVRCRSGSSVIQNKSSRIGTAMNMKDIIIALVALVLLCLLGPVVVGILSALVAVAPYLLAVLLILGVIAFFCK